MSKPVEYIVRVYDGDEVMEYEYRYLAQAESHLEWELESGFCASLYAYMWNGISGRMERIR